MVASVHERLLVVLLRLGGVVTAAAFLAVLLPHRPIVRYIGVLSCHHE